MVIFQGDTVSQVNILAGSWLVLTLIVNGLPIWFLGLLPVFLCPTVCLLDVMERGTNGAFNGDHICRTT